MAAPLDVALLIGSLRAASWTRKVAMAAAALAPDGLRFRELEIGALPLYNEDLDPEPPRAWTEFREAISGADAVLIATPEYNRSVPACLKNALDVGSRPQGQNLWDGKPAAVISVTPYKLGAFGANHHVRQALVFLNMPAMPQPEAYIGGAGDLFDTDGDLKDEGAAKFLAHFMAAFETWALRIGGHATDAGFEAFMDRRGEIAAAYCNGDPQPLHAIAATEGAVTFFPPSGGMVSGAAIVTAKYDEGAESFAPGATSRLEVLDKGAGADLAFWTGIQHYEGRFRGQDTKMKLRITEVFRRTGGEWKLAHRHADPAGEPQTPG
jgi:NAD(P)H-dependent FMN reductase/ketosteroid isomerase-like protein